MTIDIASIEPTMRDIVSSVCKKRRHKEFASKQPSNSGPKTKTLEDYKKEQKTKIKEIEDVVKDLEKNKETEDATKGRSELEKYIQD